MREALVLAIGVSPVIMRAKVEPCLGPTLYLNRWHINDDQHTAAGASLSADIGERLTNAFGRGLRIGEAMHVLCRVSSGGVARESGLEN